MAAHFGANHDFCFGVKNAGEIRATICFEFSLCLNS